MEKHFSTKDPASSDTAGRSKEQYLAVELSGEYQLEAYQQQLVMALEQGATPEVRVAAVKALMQIAPRENSPRISSLLNDRDQELDLRSHDRKSTRLNSSQYCAPSMPSLAGK